MTLWRYWRQRRIVPPEVNLILATWWVATRSAAVYTIGLGLLIIEGGRDRFDGPTYAVIDAWAPPLVWGAVPVIASVSWWVFRGWKCVIAGVVLSGWFFAFGTAFLVSYTADSRAAATAWPTYYFLGWLYMVITYVVRKDSAHVHDELQRLGE